MAKRKKRIIKNKKFQEFASNSFSTAGILLTFLGGYYHNVPMSVIGVSLAVAGTWMIAFLYSKWTQ